MNQQIAEPWTIGKIYQFVGEDTLSRWEALGQTDSDIHWAYGMEANALVEQGIPSMLVYVAIGRKAGKSAETIRKSFYTWRAYTGAQREEYHLAPYSVFDHARMCEKPEEVLQYYIAEQCGFDEIKAAFRAGEEEKEFPYSDFPRYLAGAYRQMLGWKTENRKRGEELLDEFEKLRKAENDNSKFA